MEVSSEKRSNYHHNEWIKGGRFKYIDSTLAKEGRSTSEIKISLTVPCQQCLDLKAWMNRNVSFPTKMKLNKSMVLSIFQ